MGGLYREVHLAFITYYSIVVTRFRSLANNMISAQLSKPRVFIQYSFHLIYLFTTLGVCDQVRVRTYHLIFSGASP